MARTAIVATATLAFAIVLSAALAQAQNARSFVSGFGNDTNNCTLPSPCRTFADAFAVADAGSEIDILDPADYGPLIITKGIGIVGGDTPGAMVPPGRTGITMRLPFVRLASDWHDRTR